MQRLLDDAEKISGIKYDISSFADVTEAIHVMQEQMGIAGTTSKEAASTISGSVDMVKASWENFLTGMADPDQDFGELVGGLTDSIGIALENIIPRLVQALPRLIQGLAQVIQTLVGYLPQILGALLPGLVTGATELLGALGATLPSLFMTLFDQVLPQISQAFVAFLEKVFSVPEGSFQGLTDGLNLAFATISSIFDVLFGSLSEKDNIDLLTKLGMDSGTAETIITTTTQIGDTIKSSFETAVDIVTEGAGKVADFISWFEKGGPAVDTFKAAIVGITTAWAGYKVVTGTIQAIETVRNTLLAVGNGLMLARSVQSGVLTAAEATQTAATMGASGAFGIFNAVLSANPIAIVIMAITALVAALVWFFTQTETGRQIWQGFVDFLGNAWTAISTTAQGVWNALSAFLSGIWSTIVSFAQIYFNLLVAFYSGIWNVISSTISAVWNGIASFLSGLWNGIYSTASSIFNNISSTISSVMDGISSTVSRVWNGIKDTISNAINGARDAVSNGINAIKGLFNFQIRWPHIPLPHFSVSGSANPLDWLKGGVPRIGIEWYAKGGIMNGPTVFGMNGNNAMIGGEAGPEAVLPLNDKTLGAIGRGIAQTMGSAPAINITITGNVVREEADITKIANQVAQRIADELQRKTQLRGGTI
jgi:phage-related protein